MVIRLNRTMLILLLGLLRGLEPTAVRTADAALNHEKSANPQTNSDPVVFTAGAGADVPSCLDQL